MPSTMKDLVAEARANVATVTPEEAQGSGELILDVREPAELGQSGAVPGAFLVPRGTLEMRADATAETAESRLTERMGNGRVHVLCAAGGRAAMAADTLRRMGYDATVIEGGMAGWKKAGLPVET
ncbi:rhodanese-like domain-containing protein [uncultured Jannaschia sp.]|uniref:rhodanese-like domain-containing protein n=1 Tax=uncultured Jannaschia sp. TaxID=293347 RepID=UPI00261477A6|nr:rhodanese-like domain-containing protein [uncultured Jannaschia sp.]